MTAPNSDELNAILNGLALRRLIRNGMLVFLGVAILSAFVLFVFSGAASFVWGIFGTLFVAAWGFLALGSLFLSIAKCPRCNRPFHAKGVYTNLFSGSCLSCGARLDGSNL